MASAKLLVVDDEPVIQHAFRKAFHLPEYETIVARTAEDAMVRLAADRPDVIVLDVHLPDADGLTTFDRIKAVDARTPVILITGHGTTELAIEAMKRGAYDYLLKPLRYDDLKPLIDRACESSRLMSVPTILPDAPATGNGGDSLVGQCQAMQDVYKLVGRVAATEATVLILGESGTGKELIARAIYQHSRRAGQPFLAINCGAIPESLIESELFGHEKGAFSGADRKRIGKFEQCSGGTLFLDEVGELPLLAQVKLLRVLQERQFERVGGNETVHTDIRILAATNSDLDAAMAGGTFRSDLYFRLNDFAIRLPPLRDRGDDLERLTDYALNRFSRELKRPAPLLSAETRSALKSYRWPGNIRELQSVLRAALLRSKSAVILPDDLSLSPLVSKSAESSRLDWDELIVEFWDKGSHQIYADCLSVMERQLFTYILQKTSGNQVRAAERLGINRGSLRTKLRLLGITVDRTLGTDSESDD